MNKHKAWSLRRWACLDMGKKGVQSSESQNAESLPTEKETVCVVGLIGRILLLLPSNLIKCRKLIYLLEIRYLSTPHLSVLLYYKVKGTTAQCWVSIWIPKFLHQYLDYTISPHIWSHMQGTRALSLTLLPWQTDSSLVKNSYYQWIIIAKIKSVLSCDLEKVILQFEVLLLVLFASNGLAPSYITDLSHKHSTPVPQICRYSFLICVPIKLKLKGDRAASQVWN